MTRVIKLNLQIGQNKQKYTYILECLSNCMSVKYGVCHSPLHFIIYITDFPKLKKGKAVIHMDNISIPNMGINSKESETGIYQDKTITLGTKQSTH
jgi:hypothetical protein